MTANVAMGIAAPFDRFGEGGDRVFPEPFVDLSRGFRAAVRDTPRSCRYFRVPASVARSLLASSLRRAADIAGSLRSNFWNPDRLIVRHTTDPRATTVAERGPPSRSAISPKKLPAP